MTDDILFEDGQTITADRLRKLFGRSGISGYVESGLGVTADYTAAVADIGSGTVHLLYQDKDYTIEPDARAGKPIGTDGTNHVFAVMTVTEQEDGSETLAFSYAVNQDGRDPDGPSLEIAQIDMTAEEVAAINRTAPIASKDAETYKGSDIDVDGDGVVDRADHATDADAADSVPGTGVSGQVNAAKVTDAVVDADYGDLASGDLVHTAGELGETHILIGESENFLVQDEMIAEKTFLWRDADRGQLRLGGDNAAPTLAGTLSGEDEHAIEKMDRVGSKRVVIEQPDSGAGFVIQNKAFANQADRPSIIPVTAGAGDPNKRLMYEPEKSRWRIRTSLAIEGGLRANRGVGTGLDIGLSGDGHAITPRVDGERLGGQQMSYNAATGKWRLESGFVINGNVNLNGNRLRLPRTTFQPGNASPGDMWYRTDKD